MRRNVVSLYLPALTLAASLFAAPAFAMQAPYVEGAVPSKTENEIVPVKPSVEKEGMLYGNGRDYIIIPKMSGTDGVDFVKPPQLSGTDGVDFVKPPPMSGKDGVDFVKPPQLSGTDGVDFVKPPPMSGKDGVDYVKPQFRVENKGVGRANPKPNVCATQEKAFRGCATFK